MADDHHAPDKPEQTSPGSWGAYSYHVMYMLEQHTENQKILFESIAEIRAELAAIRTRVILYGVIAAAVVGFLVPIIWGLVQHLLSRAAPVVETAAVFGF